MSRNTRIGFLVAAAAVLVVAIAVIGTGGSDDPKTPAAAPGPTISIDDPTATPDPVVRIATKDGQPVGGIQDIEVDKGDRVRFVVTSNVDDEVHNHLTDEAVDVGPGMPAEFDFKATADGIYEIELEDAGQQIIKLRVNP